MAGFTLPWAQVGKGPPPPARGPEGFAKAFGADRQARRPDVVLPDWMFED